MSTSTNSIKNACKAIVSQGPRKNKPCEKEATKNGLCIYHQRNYIYEKAIQEGKKVCGMFFRGCNNELSADDRKEEYKNCEACRKKKSQKDYPCEYNGCSFMIENKDQKYCKKHIRQHLRDNEKENSIKYCDIERGCFNPIVSGNKCDKCKKIERDGLTLEIVKLRKQYNIILPSHNDKEEYHHIYRLHESTLISISELWREVQRNAYIRNILFILNQQDFEKIVIQCCHYCGFYSTTRLNGIDRVDNNKGYIPENCLPCCKVCNLMKGAQHPLEFLTKVSAICDYTEKGIPLRSEHISKWKEVYCSRNLRLSYKAYGYNTKERNIELLLSEEEYAELLQGNCYLCGIETKDGHQNGIDRVDSTLREYKYENCKSCCGHCNIMKRSLTYNELLQKCKQITAYCINHTSFQHIPPYSGIRCRKEVYSAEEIVHLMKNGAYNAYIEWCVEHTRSPDFIDAMNQLHHTHSDVFTTHEAFVETVRSELDKERYRKKTYDELIEMKTMQCRTIYAYLTQGKEEHFVKWYETHYKKTSLFDEKLRELMDRLPSLLHKEGISACQKFMYDDKHRRIAQQRRENQQKVVKYVVSSSEEEKENTTTISSPIPVHRISTPPTPLHRVKRPIVAKKEEDTTPSISSSTHPSPLHKIKRPVVEKNEDDDDAKSYDHVVKKVVDIQNKTGYQKKSIELIKQWKTKSIYHVLKTGHDQDYKTYCEENNDMTLHPTWSTDWDHFVFSLRGLTEQDATPIITAFVENLRRLRHNKLCYDKNAGIVDKEDRQQWPATTVVRAFLDGKMEKFKAFTESSTDEDPANPIWMKRWANFIASLEKEREDQKKMKELCSKFMTAQRTKKYRKHKSQTESV